MDVAAGTLNFHVNGSSKGTFSAGNGFHVPSDNYLVGAPEPVSGSRFDGQIAEVLFYDRALTDIERNNIVVELGNTYGISVALPSAPPAAPTGFTATAADFQRIDLAWTDDSAEEDGYRVERRIGQAGDFTAVIVLEANASAYSDAGIPTETELCYRVVGFNALGDGQPSHVACGTPSAPAPNHSLPSNGLRIHLEADNLSSVLADGADVGAWPNHGSEADALQWSLTKRATFHVGQAGNLFGGRAHVGINEGSDNDEFFEITGVTQHTSATLIAVFADQSAGDMIHDLVMLGLRDSTAERAGFWTANKFSGPPPYEVAWWDAANGWKDSNFVVSGNTPYIAVWRVSGGATVDFQVNGDPKGSRTITSSIPTPFDRYRIGKSDQGQTSRFDGQIAELILFDRALTDDERDEIVYDLGQMYGISVSVPPPPSPSPVNCTADTQNAEAILTEILMSSDPDLVEWRTAAGVASIDPNEITIVTEDSICQNLWEKVTAGTPSRARVVTFFKVGNRYIVTWYGNRDPDIGPVGMGFDLTTILDEQFNVVGPTIAH